MFAKVIKELVKQKKKRKKRDKRPQGTHSARLWKRPTAHPAKIPKGYPLLLFHE
jgi:hypothetical protein